MLGGDGAVEAAHARGCGGEGVVFGSGGSWIQRLELVVATLLEGGVDQYFAIVEVNFDFVSTTNAAAKSFSNRSKLGARELVRTYI